MSGRQHLDSVADAVAAGEAVDWHDVERGTTEPGDADLIRQLKIVSAIGATRRAQAPSGPTWWDRAVEMVVVVVLAIAVAQLALALVGAPAALSRVGWPYIVNGFVFGVGGVVLLAGGGRDRRLPLLGALFLTISSAFVIWLMPSAGTALSGTLTDGLGALQADAFLALMLWRFVREFPADTQRPGVRGVASVFVRVSFSVGAVLFVSNAIGRFGDSMVPAWSMALVELLDRDHPERAYWPVLSVVAAPAIPFLFWKTRLEEYEDRRGDVPDAVELELM